MNTPVQKQPDLRYWFRDMTLMAILTLGSLTLAWGSGQSSAAEIAAALRSGAIVGIPSPETNEDCLDATTFSEVEASQPVPNPHHDDNMTHGTTRTAAPTENRGAAQRALGVAGFMGLGQLPGGVASGSTGSVANRVSKDVDGNGPVVVGQGESASGPEAFRWTLAGGMQGLGDLPGGDYYSIAYDVADNGSLIVGLSNMARGGAGNVGVAFRWTESEGIIDLPPAFSGAASVGARAISGDGFTIIGFGSNGPSIRGVRWGVPLYIPSSLGDFLTAYYTFTASQDGIVAYGYSAYCCGEQGLMRFNVPTTMEEVEPRSSIQWSPNDSNADGSVLVGARIPGGITRSAFWRSDADGVVVIGPADSEAKAITADGQWIVGYVTIGGIKQAAIFSSANPPDPYMLVSDVLTDAGMGSLLTGWTLHSANGISADGHYMVGYGTNPSGQIEAWIADVSCVFGEFQVTTTSLPIGILGAPYQVQLEADCGMPPYTFTTQDNLHTMHLSPDGLFSGTPMRAGSDAFTIEVTDSTNQTAQRAFKFVTAASAPPPELVVEKWGLRPVPGRTLTYYIVVRNVGSTDAEDTVAIEFLEPWFTYVSASPPPDSLGTFGSLLRWTLDTIVPGGFALIEYSAVLDSTFPLGELVTGTACTSSDGTIVGCSNDLTNCINVAVPQCEALFPHTSSQRKRCVKERQDTCRIVYESCFIACATAEGNSGKPVDPNEKGVLAPPFIRSGEPLIYPIHFENIGDIEALDVFLDDVLDPDLDETTIEFITPGGTYDSNTRTVSWDLLGINLQPGATEAAFFSIKPLPGLPSGTEIRNSATIQFEVFDIITTNEVVNVIDDTVPQCTMTALPATSEPWFEIAWTGTDAVGEIETYTILASVDNAPFEVYAQTSDLSQTFAGQPNHHYEFICVARDLAGNTEVQVATGETFTDTSNSVDATPPDLTAVPGAAPTCSGGIFISGTVSDPVVGGIGSGLTSLRVNGIPVVWDPLTGEYLGFAMLTPGLNNIAVVARDHAGNEAAPILQITWADSDADGVGDDCESPSLPPSPDDVLKNRYISFRPENGTATVAFRVDKTSLPVGACWVNTPDGQGNATCVDMPVYRVWPESTVHVGDCEIMPVAQYEVRATTDNVTFSGSLLVNTIAEPVLNGKKWGDVAGVNSGSQWTPPNQLANVNDILAVLAFITNAATKPSFQQANLQAISSTDPCLNAFVNTADVLILVKAVAGDAYPFTANPATCPVCP